MISNQHVAVVGGAGFLGSHLVHHLKSHGNHVRVIDNLCVGQLKFLPDINLHTLDISHDSLSGVFDGIDYVFNYAALPFIPDCFDDPLSFVNANVVGALRVIEEAHRAGVKRILQVSSAEVYGNEGNGEKMNEHCPLGPPSTYATTKAAIDALCVARNKERDVPVIVLRQFNCVGERETHAYVIPEIISQVYHAKASRGVITIDLGANTKRDFLYAGDAVAMAADLIEMGEPGEVYNMGSQETICIYSLASIIANLMRPKESLHIHQDAARLRPVEIYSLRSDNSKLYSCTTTRPQTPLVDALTNTIKYFVDNGFRWDF